MIAMPDGQQRIRKQGRSVCSMCKGFAASLLVITAKNIPVVVIFCRRCDTTPKGRRP